MQIENLALPPEIEVGLQELNGLLNIDPVLTYLRGMLAKAELAPLAERFSDEGSAWVNTAPPPFLNVLLKDASPLAVKRWQLTDDVTTIIQDFVLLVERIKDVYLDLEAAQREFVAPEPVAA
jgi:hypothetical protein